MSFNRIVLCLTAATGKTAAVVLAWLWFNRNVLCLTIATALP